jgi:hypothetical protein
MTKTLKDFLEVYKPKSPDEQKFVDKHVVIKHKDRNGNGDDVFNGNTKTIKRKEERHGYDAGEDEKVYEALKGDQHKIDANKNGKVDAHDFHLLRKKKKVAEETEEVDESYQELMALKNNIARNQKKMNSIPGIHPEKKRLAIQIEKDTKRHKALFDKHWGKNEEVDLGEAVTVNKRNYSWGKMVTVHQGSATTYPLHPEHQEKIRKLSDGDKTSFKDETGATVHAHRSGDTVHLKKPGSSNRTTAVAHSHFTEEVDIDTVLDEALDLLMSIDEKTLTPAEMKKREEVVKAIKRDDPKMDKSMAYAIATKTAKKVAEGTMPTADEPTDDNKKMAQKVRDLLAKEKKPVKEETEELDESAKIAAHLIKRYGDNVRKSHVRSAANDFGVDASKLAKAVRTKLGKTSLAEEEQKSPAEHYKADLPNILKDIRGKKKSHSDLRREYGGSWKRLANSTADEHGHNYNRNHLLAVGKQHMDQHMQEEVQIDELSATTKASYVKKASGEIDKLYDKSKTDARSAYKYYGRKNTMRKIANEEVEDLDELSVAKLKDYRTKARADAYDADDVDDERRYRKRAAGSNTAGKKIVRQGGSLRAEEAEGLDELSKGKMQDYMDKASDARGHRNLSTKKVDNRYAGVKKASDKLTKEEVESIDELSKKTMGSYVKKASGAERPKNPMNPKSVPITTIAAYQGDSETGHFGKRFNQATYDKAERLRKNRETGIKRAVDKITKEEVEAIDELSKKTMGSYVNKAAFKIGDQGITAGLKIQNNEPADKNFKRMGNRQKGIERAVKKLTKEDVINRAVERYVPEELKFTPEERLLKRINGLSEAHINTILGLFEALNKDNQNKMIEAAETREGINQILNFVLENRGN